MDRLLFVEHNGKRILIEDFSNLAPGDDFKDLLDKATQTIHSQPEQSVLALMDVSHTRFDAEIVNRMGSFVKSNSSFIKASCVIGVEGLLTIGLSAVTRLSGRNIKTFTDRTSGLDWLASL